MILVVDSALCSVVEALLVVWRNTRTLHKVHDYESVSPTVCDGYKLFSRNESRFLHSTSRETCYIVSKLQMC